MVSTTAVVPPEALDETGAAASAVDVRVALAGPLVSKSPVVLAKVLESVSSETVTVAAGDMAFPVPVKTVTVERYSVMT